MRFQGLSRHDKENENIDNYSTENTFVQNNPWTEETTTEFYVNEITSNVVHKENSNVQCGQKCR